MDENIKKLVETLTNKKQTISTMESCTGGALASAITNAQGSSLIFKFGAVTYSNEFKIKMGVPEETIKKYSVYSKETAIEMSKKIQAFTNSDFAIGITGKINSPDPNNKFGNDNEIFISIFQKETNTCETIFLKVEEKPREEVKNEIVNITIKKLLELL